MHFEATYRNESIVTSWNPVFTTVGRTSNWTKNVKLDTRYLCHFSTEIAEIWTPGTFFEDVWTYKISALYPLYSQSYESFSGNHLIHH